MSVNGLGSYTSKTRITGLGGSGLDIDSIVKQLMTVEKAPVDKLGQTIQLSQWKMDAYRDVTSTLSGFKSSFFDVLNPTTNMTSQSTYKKFTSTALDSTGVTSTVVSASGGSNASAGTHTIIVSKMATADVATGTAVTKTLQGTQIQDADVSAMNGKDFNITLDGVTKDIVIGSYTSVADLAAGLQSQISTAFGKTPQGIDKINVSQTGGILSFSPNVATVNKISLTSGTNDGLASLKFNSGDSNRLNAGLSLAELSSKFSTPLVFEGGTSSVGSTSDITNLALAGKSFNITVDGDTESYTFTSNPASVNDLASTLDTWISSKFGSNKVNVTATGNKLSFTRNNSGYFSLNSNSINYDALAQMNIASGSEAAGQLNFTINSSKFSIKASQSLSSLMSTVNSDPTANVNMIYDENSDAFSITSKQLGAGDNIVISQAASSGNFFSGASKINTGNSVTKQGVDAQVKIDGQDLVRSSNSFTVNGVTYNLLGESPNEQKVTLNTDVDTVYNNIKKFVDKYNEVIANLNGKISEEYDSSYLPLTDDQKSSMSADDITKWETKAKTGLLHNDDIIENALYNMRSSLSDSVTGVNANLASIGITTGTYDEKGKLYIDDDKLKAAIQNDPDSVMNLFSKQSSISYTQSNQRSQRHADEGLANRLSDILQDNIRTTRDSNGTKGLLLEKAGLVGDASEYTNSIFLQMVDDNTRMTDLTSALNDKENAYYDKFNAMDTAIQKMQSQGNSLLSKLGG